MGKNVAVFVDVANIFYAAKAAGVDIDYVTLLKAATAGRDFVRAYAYTGLDPDNENQRNFHQFLARHQYKVVSKDIRKYGDGKVKANLDIELVVDMMKTARNLDIAVVVSGDGDFASAIRAVQEMGVRCEVISFRGNTSSDLIDVADLFTDITQIAKVDKGSTRSGRRVADDEEDLSMTEVPDKITEGTGRGRGRGRGGRGRDRDEVAASSRGGRPARTPRSDTPRYDEVAASSSGGYGGSGGSGGQLIALPGERLSRAAAVAAPVADGEEPEELDETTGAEAGVVEGGEGAEGAEGEAGRRRRRRRGGRGRGRGRQEGDVLVEGAEPIPGEEDEEAEAAEAVEGEAPAAVAATERSPRPERPASQVRPARRTASGDLPTPFDDMDALSTSRARRPATPFGSVWDAQLGTPSRPAASGLTPLPADEEDLDEPEIPEYLLAERRRGGQGQGQGGRGGRGGGGRGGARSAYNAAIERERYGGSRGMPSSTAGGMGGGGRFAEPPRGGAGRGPQQPPRGGGRSDRPDRVERAPRAGGGEPWSEVPPELEQMLLAQMQRSRTDAPAASSGKPQQAPASNAGTAKAEPGTAEVPARRTTRRPAPAAASTPAAGSEVAPTPAAEAVGTAPVSETPKRRATRRPAAEPATPVAPAPAPAPEAPAVQAEAPKRRTTRKAATVAEAPVQAAPAAPEASAAVAAPKRRTTRKPAEATPAPAATAESAPVAEAPKRRTTTRRKAEPAEG